MQAESRAFELGKNRIEVLSDGIFAIAMTLLVLELHIPDLPPNAPNVRYFAVAGRCDAFSMGLQWLIPHRIVARAEGPNDGVVSIESARFGGACAAPWRGRPGHRLWRG